jgi:serine/threonine protein kinase
MKTNAGSLLYKAPEIFEDKYYNYKVDIWSLGAVLYFLLTAEDLIDGNSDELAFASLYNYCKPKLNL